MIILSSKTKILKFKYQSGLSFISVSATFIYSKSSICLSLSINTVLWIGEFNLEMNESIVENWYKFYLNIFKYLLWAELCPSKIHILKSSS